MFIDADLEAKIEKKKAETLYRKNQLGLPGVFILVLALLFAYKDYGTPSHLVVWVVAVLTMALGHWLLTQKFFKDKGVLPAHVWVHSLSALSFVLALMIGLSTWLFYIPENLQQTFIIAVFFIGSMFGSIIFAASYFPIHVAWSVPLVLPFALQLLSGNNEQMILGGLLIIAGIPIALILGWMMAKEYATALQLRFEKDVLLEHLQAQKDLAEKANKDKTQFLAAASHDLRQPHQALGLFVEALDHMETEPKKKEILSKTKQAFKAMSSLLDQLLDISKLDSADIQVDKQVVALQPLLHQVVMEHMGEADQKGIELRLRATQALVFVDVSMLTRIVSNLITNAIRYTQEGGVLVAVRRREGELWLDIIDTGCGIAKDKQQDIFKEFTQLNNPERDREKGLGLGLAIVQRLVNILQTQLVLESKPNQGSRFSIKLEPADTTELPQTQAINQVVSLQGLKVVVIDDDSIALESMRTLLNIWGCSTYSFSTLQACLAELKTASFCPDVLVVDYRLRGHDNGVQVVQAIRQHCQQDIRALIMTGDTDPERIKEASESGIPLTHKPVNPDDLKVFLAKIQRQLS